MDFSFNEFGWTFIICNFNYWYCYAAKGKAKELPIVNKIKIVK